MPSDTTRRLLVLVAQAVELVRRFTPAPLVPAVVRLRSLLSWLSPAVRSDARQQMSFVLDKTRPEVDVDSVARRYVAAMARRAEARWHPAMVTDLRVDGIEHLEAARAQGRGVVVSFLHHGYYDGAWPVIARHGIRCHMMVHPYMVRADAPSWIKQHVRVSCVGGGTPVSSEVGTRGILDLLAAGAVVGIASDVPGRTPVRFLGRDLLGSFGAARIAQAAGAPVVLLTSGHDGSGPCVRLHEPLQPGDFAGPEALLDTILGMHEPAVLALPEQYDLPISRWGVPG